MTWIVNYSHVLCVEFIILVWDPTEAYPYLPLISTTQGHPFEIPLNMEYTMIKENKAWLVAEIPRINLAFNMYIAHLHHEWHRNPNQHYGVPKECHSKRHDIYYVHTKQIQVIWYWV